MRKNDLVTVRITDMTFDGAGIGHVTEGERKVPVFVRAAAVGDTVECRIIKVLKNYAVGIIASLVSPSPDRIAPLCPSAEKCGGCAFGHVSYAAETEYKTNSVRQAYRLNGPAGVEIADCIPSPEAEGYRNKLQLPLGADGKFGFFSPHSHRVVSAEGCTAGHPALMPVIRAVEEWIAENGIAPYDEQTGRGTVRHLYLRRGFHSGEIMLCLTVNAAANSPLPHADRLCDRILGQCPDVKSIYVNYNPKKTNVILGDTFALLWGSETIRDTMNGVCFRISPRSFYQINTAQAERIYAHAASYLSPDDILLDLYCGIGTIGLCCADKVREVIGIEVIEAAVADAAENARLNGIGNARFFAADAAKTLQILDALPNKPTAVIVDPPRKGLSPDAIAALRSIAPKKIVYVSCNPATQARDLALLADEYAIGPVTPYDMFPRTGHVETVALLNRKKAEEPTYIREKEPRLV